MPLGAHFLGEGCKVQLGLDSTVRNEGSLATHANEVSVIDQLSDGLANGDPTDAVVLHQISLAGHQVARLEFLGALAQENGAQLLMFGYCAVAQMNGHHSDCPSEK